MVQASFRSRLGSSRALFPKLFFHDAGKPVIAAGLPELLSTAGDRAHEAYPLMSGRPIEPCRDDIHTRCLPAKQSGEPLILRPLQWLQSLVDVRKPCCCTQAFLISQSEHLLRRLGIAVLACR
jgi:hypothetical protein